jgi:glycosyltransferase involved in cell wall biosynthesis
MTQKKILILCDLFPPAFGPRMGYLCKYLVQAGWEPVVLTEAVRDDTFAFLTGLCPVVRLDYYTLKHPLLARLQWLAVFALDFLLGYKDRRMYRAASRLIRLHRFDLIACSTYRDFPLAAARRAARKYRLPFAVDIRDVIEQYAGNEFIAHPAPFGLDRILTPLFKRRSLSRRNRALRQADAVTTVSPWHVELLKAYNPAVELVYNGYDPEVFFPESVPAEQFVITYTGRLLSTAMRDPSLLFEALERLAREGMLSPATCRVRWYVDPASEALIAAQAAQAGLMAYMDFRGYVPARDIPAVLNGSSVLLLLTNKSAAQGPKGVMTTKVFESFAVEKPILCVRSDESHLAALLERTKAGLAATAVEEVCNFIRHYFRQWQAQGYTSVALDREATAAFSRRQQAGQFIRLFTQLIQTHHE